MTCKLCDPDPQGVLWETDTSLLVEGSPYRKGHLKVVLKRHATKLTELGPEELWRFTRDLALAARAVEDVLRPDKLNYALLGNWTAHLHWHIYPRYRDEPDWGQPPAIPWKEDGERVPQKPILLGALPLTQPQKDELTARLEEFDNL